MTRNELIKAIRNSSSDIEEQAVDIYGYDTKGEYVEVTVYEDGVEDNFIQAEGHSIRYNKAYFTAEEADNREMTYADYLEDMREARRYED